MEFQSEMAPELNDVRANADTPIKSIEQEEQTLQGKNDVVGSAKRYRWSKRDTLILIEAEKYADNLKGVYRSRASAYTPDLIELKWDSVASFCKRNGVNRGPDQCRKRWGNLYCDFKKIKSWESRLNNEAESFWTMKSGSRKERKLPGFFDRDIYGTMAGMALAIPLTSITGNGHPDNGDELDAAEEDTYVFEEDQYATPQDGMFAEFGQYEDEIEQTTNLQGAQFPSAGGEKVNPVSNNWTEPSSQGGRKRRRMSSKKDESILGKEIIKALEKNNNMLCAQLEAQNKNYLEDRSQQKEQTDRVVGAVNKLTEVLTRIADKLEVIAGNN